MINFDSIDQTVVDRLFPGILAAMVCDIELRIRALEDLLVDKKIFTEEEFVDAFIAQLKTKDGQAVQFLKDEINKDLGIDLFAGDVHE